MESSDSSTQDYSRDKFDLEVPRDIVKAIILDAMKNKGIDPGCIPTEKCFNWNKRRQKSKRFIETKGYAWFKCHRQHKWSSAHAWAIIDLKTQTLYYRYKQDCKKCNQSGFPNFTEDSLEVMSAYAVDEFLYRMRWQERPKKVMITRRTRRRPHDRKRCGKCKYLKRRCFK